MKRVFTLTAALIISALIYSQSPGKFSYQAVVRNSAGELVKSKDVGFKISVLQGSAGGTAVYVETHTVATNTNGLATLEIGGGSILSGTFANIDWSAGPYYIKTEADPAGGGSFTITGTSELLSVPYALYAKNAGNGFSGIYSDLSGKPVIPSNTSQLTNDTGFITSYIETDPLYTGSQAANITTSHITKLSNLSGTNTGDQDLTGLATTTTVTTGLEAKVDKVSGKGLSTNDYTTAEQTKLSAITGTNTGDQDLSGLATTTSLTTGLNTKVDKVGGKGLSTEDYTTVEKTKLAAIATGAEVNVNADWNELSGDALILNKPLIPTTTSQLTNNSGFLTSFTETDPLFSASQAANITAADITDLSNLSGINTGDQDLSALVTTGAVTNLLDTKVDKITGKGLSEEDFTTAEKTKLSGISAGAEVNVNADWNAASGDALIINKPALAIVATTGSYIDLTNTPVVDGSETIVNAGSNVTVMGVGTSADPYIVNAGSTASAQCETAYTGCINSSGGDPDLTAVCLDQYRTCRRENDALIREALNVDANKSNVFLGYWAGFYNTTGNYNSSLGTLAGPGPSTGDLTNTTAIGYAAIVNASNTIQLGNSSVTEVHAGTGTTTLIAGGLQITGGSPSAGLVLTSDATGVATWQPAGGGGSTHTIGESYGGGMVFYVYDNGQHGLIAATIDQSTGIRWDAGSYTFTMARADGVGAGKANTAIIIANQGDGNGSTYAARICNEYSVTVGGTTYGDWYLPSKFELNLLYLQKTVVPNLAEWGYWSSTEVNNGDAYRQYFPVGNSDPNAKPNIYNVRAIRSF